MKRCTAGAEGADVGAVVVDFFVDSDGFAEEPLGDSDGFRWHEV